MDVFVITARGSDPLAAKSLSTALDLIEDVNGRDIQGREGMHITDGKVDCWRVWHRDDNNVQTIFTIHRIEVQ